MYEEICLYFVQKWPENYYLADFILNWLISNKDYYYNYNTPSMFSISGKTGEMFCIYNFIESVANGQFPQYKSEYKPIVEKLIQDGAPTNLFAEKYNQLKFSFNDVYFYFFYEWPVYYYLADFILNWLISHKQYKSINLSKFSINAEKVHCIYNFIKCVANTQLAQFKSEYKLVVKELIENGAPPILFHEMYI